MAKPMVDAGLIVLVSFISPFRSERRMARALVDDGEFIEVFVDAPPAVAEERDPRGLHRQARRGQLKNFTGIDLPYETPEHAEIRVDTTPQAPESAAEQIVAILEERGVIGARQSRLTKRGPRLWSGSTGQKYTCPCPSTAVTRPMDRPATEVRIYDYVDRHGSGWIGSSVVQAVCHGSPLRSDFR